ncbi:MAG: UDP-glucose 4-epimerase GalE [Pseudomonadota bacterium]
MGLTKILLTGGAGFIGSHVFVALKDQGYEPVILDNFANSSYKVLERLERLYQKPPVWVEADIADTDIVTRTLSDHDIDAVIHFAGLKAVGESMAEPLKYYQVNVGGSERLLAAMGEVGCKRLVFSSSATVYGDPQYLPLDEDHPVGPTSVYGQTKLVVEDMIRSLAMADPEWSAVILRYFNPVGAHKTGLIGEDPSGIPNNLMPFISQVAVGRRERLSVFGDDYETPDGTGVRDYIHVCDLADGHVAALGALGTPGAQAINLGTGTGYSVLEMVKAFEKASGRPVPYAVEGRRAGDVESCYADPKRAEHLLGWRATRGIDEMCADTWRWQAGNPEGYETPEAA